MDSKESVPYIVHESAMMRADRHICRLIVALIIAIAQLFISNAVWLWTWSRYDFSSYELDGGGINVVGSSNEVRQYEPIGAERHA